MAIRVMELSADSSDAVFTVTLDAAERYICELKLTSEVGKKNALNENCQSLLEETERIKAAQREGNRSIKTTMLCAMPDIGSTPKEPLSMRDLSTREQITLLEGSKLHGCIFPPWTKLPSAIEFEPQAGEPLYQCVAQKILSFLQYS